MENSLRGSAASPRRIGSKLHAAVLVKAVEEAASKIRMLQQPLAQCAVYRGLGYKESACDAREAQSKTGTCTTHFLACAFPIHPISSAEGSALLHQKARDSGQPMEVETNINPKTAAGSRALAFRGAEAA